VAVANVLGMRTFPADVGGGTEVRVVHTDLLAGQDAVHAAAVGVPTLRVYVRGCRVRMMALKAMALSPDLDAMVDFL